ncbi:MULTISPECIES: CYTH domain-containing protein [Halomonadaceae]|uniref:CYTH domain-containing protein n=1 Tax=Halomonadaceae TaxID=28256 RepID=UPI001C629A7C|nr:MULTISPECIES: CYTH domain-containing protein [Halomonas]MCG7589236.1 CYTH domain-containing protein [Halomonas sp. McD50-5]MCG7615397.1 CYTH domain-containing protein [Halomonas sp. McD50-4]
MKESTKTPAPTEVELKLALPSGQSGALCHHPLLAATSPHQQQLANTYFDTPTGDLAAARVAVRLRTIDQQVLQTVKTAGQGGGGLSSRQEWEWQVPSAALDQAALAELPPFQGALGDCIAALRPTLSTDFTRKSWQLVWQDSDIELVLDEGEIVCGSARAPIREVELELKAGAPAALWTLAVELASQIALRPSDTSKAARGNALGHQHWPLPTAKRPAEWLHRATVALDAYHDSGDAAHLNAARQALDTLAQHPQLDSAARSEAEALPNALNAQGMPSTTYGVAALNLARRLAHETALR